MSSVICAKSLSLPAISYEDTIDHVLELHQEHLPRRGQVARLMLEKEHARRASSRNDAAVSIGHVQIVQVRTDIASTHRKLESSSLSLQTFATILPSLYPMNLVMSLRMT